MAGALDAALRAAEDSNDGREIGRVLCEQARAFAEERERGKAAAKLELAAEAFRAAGDSTNEAQALRGLAKVYTDLRGCPLQAVRERLEFLKEEAALKEAGDAESSAPSAKASPRAGGAGARLVSSFMSILGNGVRDLHQVEKDKLELRSLVALARTQDANETYLQRHLMQVRFEQLPFDKIEHRVSRAAAATFDALDERAQRVYSSLQEFSFLIAPQKQRQNHGGGARPELETFLAFVDNWDDAHIAWAEQASDLMQHVKDHAMAPLASLRNAHKALCRHFFSQRAHYERLVVDAQINLEQEIRNEEEYGGNVGAIAVAKQRVEAAHGAFKAAHQRSCRELQLVEQSRIEVLTYIARVLLESQERLARRWQSASRTALTSLDTVEAASDVRAFCNRTLIASVLSGKEPASALLQGPGRGAVGAAESPSRGADRAVDAEEEAEAAIDADVAAFADNLREGRDSPPELIGRLCESFQNRRFRRDFLLALNRLRAQQTRLASLAQLVLLIIGFLDAVYIEGDVKSAKMALILAETFYAVEDGAESEAKDEAGSAKDDKRDEPKGSPKADNVKAPVPPTAGRRVYVQDHIKDHGIWKSPHFWEETFFLALREEVHRNVVTAENGSEAQCRRRLSSENFTHIAFAQISSSAFNMSSLGLPSAQVGRFLLHAALFAGLDQARLGDLQARLGVETPAAGQGA